MYLVFFLFLVLFQAWTKYAELNFSIIHLLHWFFLFGWLMVVSAYKLTSKFSLGMGLAMMIAGIVIFILGPLDFTETIIRFGFVAWLVGIGQALLEYRK